MKIFIKNKFLINLAITLVITLAYFLAIKLVFGFAYRINDDQAMMNIISGSITGTPDGHAMYIQYPLGYFISRLYILKSNYDWYSFVMIFFNFASIFFVLFRILNVKEKLKKRIIFVFLFLLFFSIGFVFEVVTFQFTTVAAILGGASLFWIYTIKTNSSKKNIIANYIIGILLVIGSFCVRMEIGLVSLLLIFLVWFYKWLKEENRFSKKIFVKYSSLIFIILVLSVLVKDIDIQAYSGKEWKEFKEYNSYRSGVCDFYGFPEYDENKDFYSSIGITEESYDLMNNYCLIIDKNTDQESIKAIYEKAKELKDAETSLMDRFKDVARNFYKNVYNTYYAPVSLFITFIFFGFILYYFRKRDYSKISFVCSFVFIKITLWGYLIFAGRTVERVGISLYILDFMFLTALILDHREILFSKKIRFNIKNHIINKLFLAAFVMFVLLTSMYNSYSTTKAIATDLREKGIAREELDRYMFSHPDNIYFFDINLISRYTWKINSDSTGEYLNAICLGGWTAFSPPEEYKIKKYGITNIEDALLNDDRTYIIADEEKIKVYIDYFESKYDNFKCEYVDIFTSDSGDEFYIFDLGLEN